MYASKIACFKCDTPKPPPGAPPPAEVPAAAAPEDPASKVLLAGTA